MPVLKREDPALIRAGLRALVSEIHMRRDALQAPRKRKMRPARRAFLIAAVPVLCGGLLWTAAAPDPKPAPPAVPQPHPAEAGLSASGIGAGQSFNRGIGCARGLRPADFLDALAASGHCPRFEPAGSVRLPADGKELTLYCLLRAQLDDYTERLWQRAGLLRRETRVLSPFLRTVTVSDAGSLNYLLDWHVEGVAASLP